MNAATNPAGADASPRGGGGLAGIAVGVLVALAAPAAIVLAHRRYEAHVPEPLPIHWGFDGTVDNTATMSSLLSTTLLISGLFAAGTVVAAWRSRRGASARFGAAGLAFGAYLSAGIAVLTFAVSAGAARAEDVALPLAGVIGVLVVAGAAAAAVWASLPSLVSAALPGPDESDAGGLVFAPGEKVTWLDRQHSAPLRWVSAGGLVIAVAGFVYLPAEIAPIVGIIGLVSAALTFLLGEVAVRIDAAGLHVLWGPLAWPRSTLDMADIVAARAEDISPMQWGGWGYRISGRGTAVVLRRGPGIVVDRTNGRAFAVTVPRATDGAAVLNALIRRDGGTSRSSKRKRRR